MNGFRQLTGLLDDQPATGRAGIRVAGEDLLCLPNERRRAGHLPPPALGELRMATADPGAMPFHERVADVVALHADPGNADAVLQAALQFNLLKMVRPHVTPDHGFAGYAHDMTQGPAGAMASAAGTIWPNDLLPTGDRTGQSAARQIDTSADIGRALGNAAAALWDMRNGNLLPCPASPQPLPDARRRCATCRGSECRPKPKSPCRAPVTGLHGSMPRSCGSPMVMTLCRHGNPLCPTGAGGRL